MSKKKQEFDAIITFVAEDYSHGFVKIISDYSKLDGKFLRNKTIQSFRFKPDAETEPSPNQIIRIQAHQDAKDAW